MELAKNAYVQTLGLIAVVAAVLAVVTAVIVAGASREPNLLIMVLSGWFESIAIVAGISWLAVKAILTALEHIWSQYQWHKNREAQGKSSF